MSENPFSYLDEKTRYGIYVKYIYINAYFLLLQVSVKKIKVIVVKKELLHFIAHIFKGLAGEGEYTYLLKNVIGLDRYE